MEELLLKLQHVWVSNCSITTKLFS